MEAVLMFFAFIALAAAVGLYFCFSIYAVYKSLKEKDYESACFVGFFLLILLSAMLVLLSSLI